MTGASPERWREIDRIVDAALDLAPDERAGFVGAACGSDAALRADVERLLRSCHDASGFLEQPAAEFASPLLDAVAGMTTTSEGMHIGPYRVIREAGRGGMGTVYLAQRDDEQYHHEVALKVVRRGFDADPSVVRRFVEERQILASLEHPNIARLLDGGVTAKGMPYFAMEYVRGTPIDRYCDERRLGIDERLRLFESVCDAVQYAHQRLVVHRDLKPSNILVTDDGTVKLLDFGIAKLLAPDTGGTGRVETIAGLRLMTPEYASPEQLRGEPVSTASDVYSLGVLLYELLVGRRPHDTASGSSHEATLDVSRSPVGGEVTRPSIAVGRDTSQTSPAADAAEARRTTVARLRKRLAGDLDTIVLTAMRTEPERRYGSAEQLGADIHRHLTGRPVSARPDTLGYRVHKFVRRNRAGVGAGVAVVLLLAGSTVITLVQSARIARERDTAAQVSGFLADLFNAADPYEGTGRELTARMLLDSGAARVARDLAGQPAIRAHLSATIGRAYYGLGRYADARRLLEQALSQRESLSAGGDTSTARTMNLLAGVMLDQGDNVAAESLHRRALALRRRLLGAEHPDVAATMRGLALSLRARGEHAQAESLLRRALAIQERQRPPNTLDMATTMNALAHMRRAQRDFAGAESLYRQTHALRRTTLGDDHPDVANSLVNIGAALAGAGKYEEAEPLLRRGIASKSESLGDDHPDVATDMGALAGLLLRKGDTTAAETLYREVLSRQRRLLPPGHSRTVEVLVGLSETLLARGAAVEAEPLLREALAIERRIMPAGHPSVQETARMLDRCLRILGTRTRP